MSSFDIFMVVPGEELYTIVANRPDFSAAMTKALTLAMNRYDNLRDQLNHWSNNRDCVKLEYVQDGHGFILSYNDNATTRMKSEMYKVVDATFKR